VGGIDQGLLSDQGGAFRLKHHLCADVCAHAHHTHTTPSHLQEQRIRASHNIKKLSQRLTEQRLKVADRITKGIGIKRTAAGVKGGVWAEGGMGVPVGASRW
jgi:hypothetical protein